MTPKYFTSVYSLNIKGDKLSTLYFLVNSIISVLLALTESSFRTPGFDALEHSLYNLTQGG